MTQAKIEQQGEATAVGGVLRGSSWVALLEAGVVTGAASGALMMATLMVQSGAMGYGAPFPLNVVGATFRGPEALVILLFMTYVVLPYANPTMRQRVIDAPGTWFFCHVAFGLGVGTAPLIKRLFRSRRETRDEPIIAAEQ